MVKKFLSTRGEAMVRLGDLLSTKVITDKMVCELRAEWDTFVRLADKCIDHESVLAFFELHQKELPMFARVSQILSVYATSSAACERVFSMLRTMFGDKQESSLEDYKAAAVQLKYNKRST